MAMRVARGLLRLWLVLSVLWIGGVGVVIWRTFPEGSRPPSVTFRRTNDLKIGTVLGLDASSPIWIRNNARPLQTAILLALIPPAFVLALGSALIWAIKGFR